MPASQKAGYNIYYTYIRAKYSMIITEDYIFLFNPRTGSRSTKVALEKASSDTLLWESRAHHAHARVVSKMINKHTFRPVYATVRNPADQMASWYQHVETSRFESFEHFCEEYSNGRLLSNRLNIFENVPLPANTISYLPFDLGITEIVRIVTEKLIPVTHIGKSAKKSEDIITPRSLEIIQKRFPKDVQLYQEAYAEYFD